MLIEFTVSNYKSIKEPQTLSMLATNAKEHPDNVFQTPEDNIRLLKTAVIYGANASGKSNLISSFISFVLFLSLSPKSNLGDEIKYYYPFKFDGDLINEPTSISIEFFGADKIRYKYIVGYNQYHVLNEELYSYPKGHETKLFIRKYAQSIDFGDALKGSKKVIESQLLDNQLFLSKGSINNNKQLGQIFTSIRSIFSVDYFDMNDILNDLNPHVDTTLIESISSLIRSADTGIENIYLEVYGGKTYVKSNHKIRTGNFESIYSMYLDEESDGTKKLFKIGGAILFFIRMSSVLLVDELSNNLHPLITDMLIKLIHAKETNPLNSQLIFTTHDTSILSSDIFRRDQIWFTEKDEQGGTSLYSLSEFDYNKVRANGPFDKWYLSGRFGALPLIKEFNFPTHAETQKGK